MIRLLTDRGLNLWKIVDDANVAKTNRFIIHAVFNKNYNAPSSLRSNVLNLMLSTDILSKLALFGGNLGILSGNIKQHEISDKIGELIRQSNPLNAITELLSQQDSVLTPADCLRVAITVENEDVVIGILDDSSYYFSSQELDQLANYASSLKRRRIVRIINQHLDRQNITTAPTIQTTLITTIRSLYDSLKRHKAFLGLLWAIVIIWALGNL